MPPVVSEATPYDAVYNFSGFRRRARRACSRRFSRRIVLRMSRASSCACSANRAAACCWRNSPSPTVLALAFLMNYSGATATLAWPSRPPAAMFPFFSALLGWLGVFLTGSDTSANALFGNLQVVTAQKLE